MTALGYATRSDSTRIDNYVAWCGLAAFASLCRILRQLRKFIWILLIWVLVWFCFHTYKVLHFCTYVNTLMLIYFSKLEAEVAFDSGYYVGDYYLGFDQVIVYAQFFGTLAVGFLA